MGGEPNQERFMTSVGWSMVDAVSQVLERNEREAVLGDLVEAGESAWRGLLDVLSLVIRRQAILWKCWRPWLAAFGLALPSSLLLMGVSVSISSTYQRLIGFHIADSSLLPEHSGFSLLLCHILLLIAWSWTGGFVVGSVSRRTLWVSVIACCSPCLFCLARFRTESLPRLCLLLFLLPAIFGVLQGLRIARIKLRSAILLAVTVTVLMILAWSNQSLWVFNWVLIWPAWYVVAIARKSGKEIGSSIDIWQRAAR
jgi:hypothetical protein